MPRFIRLETTLQSLEDLHRFASRSDPKRIDLLNNSFVDIVVSSFLLVAWHVAIHNIESHACLSMGHNKILYIYIERGMRLRPRLNHFPQRWVRTLSVAFFIGIPIPETSRHFWA